ncbi:MAG TPA: hypothetical protein VIL41_04390 [Coriobacteriia bacterium]
MPVNIIVGLIALIVAMTLYSIGTWSAFRAKGFSSRPLALLWVGVVFDVLATAMMGMQIGGLDLRPGAPLLHTVLALLAMAGMVAGATVATWAVSAGRSSVATTVSRVLVAPWALWVGVFVWGMVTRGAARMGG